MDFLKTAEDFIDSQLKSLKLPGLPRPVRMWLKENIWWVSAAFAVISGISVLSMIGGLIASLSALAAFTTAWYAAGVGSWILISRSIDIALAATQAVLFGMAVGPLQEGQRRGWRFLFVSWMVSALSLLVSLVFSLLSLQILGFLATLVFGGFFLVFGAYVLFSIRGEFAHLEKSAGVKHKKPTEKK